MKNKICIYVLRLENNFYYIGLTKNFNSRQYQHENYDGSKWTKIHAPVVVAEKIFRELTEKEALKLENEVTLSYMNKYGVNRVRGGSFCYTNDEKHLSSVKAQTERRGNKLFLLNSKSSLEPLKSILAVLKKLGLRNVNYIYVLKLEDNNIYIGSTNNLQKTIKDQFLGKRSLWCSMYKPKELLEIIDNKDLGQGYKKSHENEVVAKYMKQYGVEYVRGGDYKFTDYDKHMNLVSKKLSYLL